MQKRESWKGRYVWERNEQWIETEREKNMLLLFFNMLVLTSFQEIYQEEIFTTSYPRL